MTWSNPPTQFISEAEREYGRMFRGVALELLTGVIERSPVRTGRFRGNNMVSVGQPDDSYSMDDYPETARGAIAQGQAVISGVDNPFQLIFISNNLPYSESLEQGHSGQAPAGIYEVTINSVADSFG